MASFDDLLTSHGDPGVHGLVRDTLRLSKELEAPKAVIESLENCLQQISLRMKFEYDTATPESKTCEEITTKTMSHDWAQVHKEGKTTWDCRPGMISSRESAQFLKSFLSASKAKQVLEVGTFTGFTAIAMAEALPSDGKITTIDMDDYLKTVSQTWMANSPHKDKVDFVIGQAMDVLKKMAADGKTFDVVFLDAAKTEYGGYLKICMEDNLLSPNGTVIVDNAFMHGGGYLKPESPSAQFAEIIKADSKLHTVLVPIKDGIFLIRRRAEVDGGKV